MLLGQTQFTRTTGSARSEATAFVTLMASSWRGVLRSSRLSTDDPSRLCNIHEYSSSELCRDMDNVLEDTSLILRFTFIIPLQPDRYA
jgi:hypothetical protein